MLRLCSIGVLFAILLADGVFSNNSQSKIEENEGQSFTINVLTVGHIVTNCHLKSPHNEIFTYKPNDVSANTDKYLININAIMCSVTVKNIEKTDEGLWEMSFDQENGNNAGTASVYLTVIAQEIVDEEDEDENITLLSMINHYTRKEMYIDISLDNKSFEEECYVLPPNGVLTKIEANEEGETNFEMENVLVQSKSNYVSCRITLGPMSESLLGDWRLCGKSTQTGAMRCQPANIAWNNNDPNAIWGTTIQSVFVHPVHYGGSVNPGVARNGDSVITCHVITPNGEDLVITSDVKYPHIERIDANQQSLCSINFYDIDASSIGKWTVYGKFHDSRNRLSEIHLPLRFFLYNEDLPYEQAYNVTTLPEDRYLVILERTRLEVNVDSIGQVDDCQYRMPTGQSFDLNNAVASKGIILKSVDTAPTAACRIVFSPITEDMLGEWQLIGKFSNGNQFIERRQPFEIKKEYAENEDEDENITLLSMINHYTRREMYIDISLDNKSFEEECYVLPPNGVLTKIEANGEEETNSEMENVLVQSKSNYVSCRITLGPMSESLLGDWRLCGKSTQTGAMRCQPANIAWNNNDPNAIWGTTIQSVLAHPVHYGGSVNPGVARNGDSVITCHVITPNGEDLVITSDVKYPHIERIDANQQSLCSINFYDIDASSIGKWTIYAKFHDSRNRLSEIQLPLRFFLYNEDLPYEQAYNVTTLPEDRYLVILERTRLEVNVDSIGQVDDCQYRMPTGQSFDLKNAVASKGIILKSVDTAPTAACRMVFSPITEDMLGEWQLIGKFSNGNQFIERRQPFQIKEGGIESSDSFTNILVNEGDDHTINVMTLGRDVKKCQLKTPHGALFTFAPGDESASTDKYHINLFMCSVTVNNIDKNDEGLWVMSYEHTNENDADIVYVNFVVNRAENENEDEYESENEDEDKNEDENENITLLSMINHYTRKGMYIDISLDNKSYEEECYVLPPNGVLTKIEANGEGETNFEMENVLVQSKSNYVSCRITLGPMSESLLGDWRLCGKSTQTGVMRCQPANIAWNDKNNPAATWYPIIKPVFEHPVHYGGGANPGVAGDGNVITCHVITPNGEDLVITSDVKYPHIQKIVHYNIQSLCSIHFHDMDASSIGEWTIYGKFRAETLGLNEVRQPLRFFLYNEDLPYEQAYNVTTLPEDRYLVILGRDLEVNVKSFGQIMNCQYRMPTGQSYDLYNVGASTGIKLSSVDTIPACRITFSSITEDMLGEWQLIGKFRNGDQFNERRQPFHIIKEDPEAPIVDDFRVVENLTEIIFDSELGASHRVTIDNEHFVENESCHLLTPHGRQYAFIDGFNVPNVGILKGSDIECGVEVNVQSLDMLGEWTLIARATRLSAPIERRRSFTIRIEETSSLGNAITIIEGADLYLSLPSPTHMYDTCKLYGPNDEAITNFEVDDHRLTSCGYIVRNVAPTLSGTWAIVYGNTVTYRSTVEVNILALVDISLEDLVWTAGSAVNITVGPQDAVYCSLSDGFEHIVYDGFGPCRIVLDSVTMEHKGVWRISIGLPGTVRLRYSGFYVNVLSAASRPVVTTGVARNGSSVMLTCSVPIEYEVHACLFRNPRGNVLIASHGVGQDGYMGSVIRYESDAESHNCTLRLLSPSPSEHQGIWRCAVDTARDISYGFLTIPGSMLDQPSSHYNTEPELISTLPSFEGAEGDAMTLSCSIDAAARYCYFRAPNGTVFNVGPSTSSAGYEYFGNGLDAGECGIRFNNLWSNDSGHWSCSVGLFDNLQEQRYSFDVNVSKPMYLYHGWQGGSLMLRLSIWDAPKLEYCRFVRIDGLAFTSDYVPYEYDFDSYEMKSGICALTIPSPTSEDLRPWVVSAKVNGTDGELSVTSTLRSPSPHITEKSIFMAVLIWTFFSILCLLLIVAAVSLIPKKNREWTYRRATHIRNSFRKQPQTIHTDILTDLPRKV